jgi:superfamily II DNA or RNA helicase/HKD family nuclease
MPTLTYGLYEQVINRIINENLAQIEKELVQLKVEKLDFAESSQVLAEYFAHILCEVLDYIGGDEAVKNRVDLCNSIIEHIVACIEKGAFGLAVESHLARRIKHFLVEQDAKLLLALVDERKAKEMRDLRPETSLAENSLFTGAAHEPSMLTELQKEILTCDRIDFLVSFIKWSGLRLIINELQQFTMKGGRLRIITTSYLGATDYKAVERLSALPNTEIRISYDTERTRLHAKTYVFWRETGFSTAYIGSSNISESAMTSGLEWNIKLSQYDSKHILEKIRATFEVYWNDAEFVPFIPAVDAERLRRALSSERRTSQAETNGIGFNFDIKPYYYQQEILDRLQAEREVHGSYHNLIVAATGTGKTVIAAFDYRNFCRNHPNQPNRLLFVAHRKEILNQSRDCFRGILKDLNFGALMVGGIKPENLDHLFVSIQSFNSKELIQLTLPDYYDYIVVDEFHHAAAPSYQELLDYYQPQILLGLTATPERVDGKSIFKYFDHRIAGEIRLYEAIERKLLSPFHYFGVTDNIDLRQIRWVNGGYDSNELENVYVFEKAVATKRVGYIIDAIDRYCTERSELIGIGFCVSKKHAAFMAEMFNNAGIPSEFLISESGDEIRDDVKRRLVTKEINFVFVVDIYNEGVDIPEVNTVLFLRPTESLTVFLQQLGRGLRLCDDKEALTVLDFVGHAHNQYSFVDRFKALLSRTRRTVEYEIKHSFANVPRGCSIQLEKQVQEYILENIKNSINNRRNILYKLHDLLEINQELRAIELFENYHVSPQDVYSKKVTVTGLAEQTGLIKNYTIAPDNEKLLAAAFGRLSLANSRRWLGFLLTILPQIKESRGALMNHLNSVERTMLVMLYYTIWSKGFEDLTGRFQSIEESIYWAIADPMLYRECLDLLKYQYEKIDFTDKPLNNVDFECVLDLYCSYTLDQILVALGKHTEMKKSAFREGVLYIPEKNLDVFFVTLNKSEKDYSPSTMYNDYSINDELFHWQSQSRITEDSPTGQRYIHQLENGDKVLFFVREYKKDLGLASPFTCLGLADYDSHYGSAPISIRWRMKETMPSFVLSKAMKV